MTDSTEISTKYTDLLVAVNKLQVSLAGAQSHTSPPKMPSLNELRVMRELWDEYFCGVDAATFNLIAALEMGSEEVEKRLNQSSNNEKNKWLN